MEWLVCSLYPLTYTMYVPAFNNLVAGQQKPIVNHLLCMTVSAGIITYYYYCSVYGELIKQLTFSCTSRDAPAAIND